MADPEIPEAVGNQNWALLPIGEAILKLDDANETVQLILDSLRSTEELPLDDKRRRELVTDLGAAGLYIRRSSLLLAGALTTDTENVTGQPAPGLRTRGGQGESSQVPANQVPSDVGIRVSMRRSVSGEASDGEPADNSTSSEPITNGPIPFIEIDPKYCEEANTIARSQYGDRVRVVRIKDGGVVNIEGVDIPLSRQGDLAAIRRARVLAVFINNRGHNIEAKDIRQGSGIDQVSTIVTGLAVRLFGRDNTSIIVMDYVRAKKYNYRLADDVFIVDEQTDKSTQPIPQPPRLAEPIAVQGVAAPSPRPHNPVRYRRTAPKPPAVVPAPKPPVVIGEQEAIVDGAHISLSKMQSSLLVTFRDIGRPLGEVETVQLMTGRQEADNHEVGLAGDALFSLYKKGLLKLVRVGKFETEFEFNPDPKAAQEKRTQLKLGQEVAYLDNEDTKMIEIIASSVGSITPKKIAEEFFGSAQISSAQMNFVIRAIRYLFVNSKAIKKAAVESDKLKPPAHVPYELNPRAIAQISKLIGRDPVNIPVGSVKSAPLPPPGRVARPENPPDPPPSVTARKAAAVGAVATGPSPEAVNNSQLFSDHLIVNGETTYRLSPLETRLVKMLEGSFGTPLLEIDVINEFFGANTIEERQAFIAAFSPLFEALGNSGHLLRDVGRGGIVKLSLQKPLSERQE